MVETFPSSSLLPRRRPAAERRQANRAALDRNVRLLMRGVEGFALDVSESGARIAVYAGVEDGGTVLISVDGEATPRLAVVQWARPLPDGSILGVEFLGEVDADADDLCLDIAVELDGEFVLDEHVSPLDGPTTQIRPMPICRVHDVSDVRRTPEEGSVRILDCIRLVA